MDPFKILGAIAAIIGIPYAIFKSWREIVAPRLASTKIMRVYSLVKEWYDYIDRNLDHGLDKSHLHDLEDRVSNYIVDNGLKNYKMRFSRKLRKKFLKTVGLRRDLLGNRQLFEQRSSVSAEGIHLQLFWWTLMGKYREFEKLYKVGQHGFTYGEITRRMLLFKVYSNAKES